MKYQLIAYILIRPDTTSLSFYGKYEANNNSETININYGHSKDHRPNCKQMKIGQITNEAGIMVSCNSLDGNTSDVTWNKEALKLIKELQSNFKMIDNAIYVADCKLMTKKLFLKMTDDEDEVLFLSRVPASFDRKLESRIREKAYEENDWDDIGKIGATKKACKYKIQEFKEEVYGVSTRLVVVKSSASLASFKASQRKKKKKFEKAIKDLNKKEFACKKDAKKELDNFCAKYKKLLTYFM